jgi:hypothetical protein
VKAVVIGRREYEWGILSSEAHHSTKLKGELSMGFQVVKRIIADGRALVITFISQ